MFPEEQLPPMVHQCYRIIEDLKVDHHGMWHGYGQH